MSGNEKKPTPRKDLKEQIIKKALSDKDFKEVLVNNPKEAIGRLGVQLPEDVEVKVVEESPGVVYLVLPVEPGGLTDDQLGDVAGGAGWNSEGVPSCGSRWVE
ncbi:NHLP leader peptide family RiPP precursor [Pelotomaculum propionicicum]|uniref:Thiocyanate hydrolase subunit gamma n=1 Tax=Pelotomaculum propionicicum TaxID=258475 RepID=A0A4Y7RWR5_9FIRM|nr:NHLP leader peptide family RiPP precursor [Pelotomaculum propionicicum]NLI13979.1 NHLP leader peptide family natural product precursor [Peptococcaceae bacterium]TEB13166.1 Thiocyanate hydrolase subunit gamma [Pelotomaculum propionicicum]